jgi:hypothetical protein
MTQRTLPILRAGGQRRKIPTGEDGAAAGGDRRLITNVVTRVLHGVRAHQRLDAGVSVAVPKLGKCRRSQCDLEARRQPFVDEALEPTQRRSLVAAYENARPA